mgnify:CR=1 FL=1
MSNAGILVLNSGSTSLKFALYSYVNNQLHVVAQGGFAGMPANATLSICNVSGAKFIDLKFSNQDNVDHEAALKKLLTILQDKFPDLDISYAGHRIVLGGDKYLTATKLDDESLDYLESLSQIEPTHQYYEVMGARALAKVFHNIKQSATFDTSFHRTMPEVAEFYPVPETITNHGVRHWGFHGISYAYISSQLKTLFPHAKKTIVAHLGGGASLCAMQDFKSIETSMQFGAITGLPMATRSGDFPADAIFYLLKQGFYNVESLEKELEKHSGLLGASLGLSEDMRTLETSDNEHAKKALAYFEYAVLKYIGAYTAALGGLDALIFTAGIGEHDAKFRTRICERLTWLGIELDYEQNQQAVGGSITHKISSPNSKIDVYVIPTNEELMIAQNVVELYLN